MSLAPRKQTPLPFEDAEWATGTAHGAAPTTNQGGTGMKRVLVVLGLALVLALSLFALAQAETKAAAKAEPKTMTVTGEIVDLGCYMGHGAKGESHRECALKCAAMGMPIGVLTGKGQLYLLTINHDDAAPFNQCKDWAGTEVSVTGPVMMKSGMKAIEVAAAKQAAAAAAK